MSSNAFSGEARRPVIFGPSTQDGQVAESLPAVPVPTFDLPIFDADTVKSCTDTIDNFRTGNVNRVEAIYEILDVLKSVANAPKATVLQACQMYIGMLDSWERSQTAAHERGIETSGNVAGAASGSGAGGQTPTQATQVESPSPERDARPFLGTKRCCVLSVDDSDDDDERITCKRPLDLTELPWFDEADDQATLLSEPLERTRRHILLFDDEPRRWKTFVTNQRNCPQFPDSEWTNVIAGKSVNLDTVFASVFSVAVETKHKEKIGRVSIAYNEVTPSKAVKTHGDWLAAWECTSEAITFVFRHRASELDAYRSHISQLFTVLGPSMPEPVISYDKGVHQHVSSRHDLLLTDVISFLDLQTHYITIGAWASTSSSQSGGSRTSGKPRKRDACCRWNDGKCPNTNKECNYAHCCAKCMSPGHTAGACTGHA